jgi:hypothetical protein
MSYRYVYDPIALSEYKEAISWYHERSELAAEGFVNEVNEKLAAICKDPFRFRILIIITGKYRVSGHYLF